MSMRKLILPAVIVVVVAGLFINSRISQRDQNADSMADLSEGVQQVADGQTTDLGQAAEAETHNDAANTQSVSDESSPTDATDPRAADRSGDSTAEPQRSTRTLSTISDNADVPAMSDRVYYVIEEAQRMQQADQWEAALMELNALYASFENLTPFEQMTLLNFYTNTLIRLEMWQESITAFSKMLTVPDLRPDINARALLALGQLHQQVNEAPAAVTYYEAWLDFTENTPGLEAQRARVRDQMQALR
ncbi:hypothetical protein QGM61_06055 [Pseudohongiella sp. SYSU M77423]|uniref:hypothetical protein n=1 Tax=Pseudohongiella sp. SYSU M77423 TaxID=3042312 RepID=UPI002480ECA8|nr:hypothetical protein [Pseudohongiella sp. SYSU M77423]MDH7943377.1 hypothetical protein [Pseudohongiella sp. SYSU M77423]